MWQACRPWPSYRSRVSRPTHSAPQILGWGMGAAGGLETVDLQILKSRARAGAPALGSPTPRAFRCSDPQILKSRARAGAQAPGLRTFRFSGRGISTPRAFRSSDLQILRSKEAVTRCGGDVVCRSGCRVCTACGQGSGVAQTVSRCHELKGDTEFDKTLKRSAKSLRTCNNIWGRFAAQSDPNYAPEWTKRRRL